MSCTITYSSNYLIRKNVMMCRCVSSCLFKVIERIEIRRQIVTLWSSYNAQVSYVHSLILCSKSQRSLFVSCYSSINIIPINFNRFCWHALPYYRHHSVTHTLSHTVWTELVLDWKWWDSSGRCAASCTYWSGTVSVCFDHHALSRSPASIASADPARAGSLRVTRAGRGDTAPW